MSKYQCLVSQPNRMENRLFLANVAMRAPPGEARPLSSSTLLPRAGAITALGNERRAGRCMQAWAYVAFLIFMQSEIKKSVSRAEHRGFERFTAEAEVTKILDPLLHWTKWIGASEQKLIAHEAVGGFNI